MSQFQEAGTYKNLSASGQVSKSSGSLLGFYVNSTTAGTLVLTDSAASTGGTTMSGTITPAIGFHRWPAYCVNGLYATIGGSALDVTFFFAAG